MTDPPLCGKLEWDSNFFGVSIARAHRSAVDTSTCAAMLDWCEVQRIDCLYMLCAFDDRQTAEALEQAAFRQVDVRVTLERALESWSTPSELDADDRVRLRPARIADIPALRAIAGVSHRDTRFHHDGHFGAERCDELYATWIDNSCRGYADHVVVAEGDGAAVGYLSLHLETAGARIGLVGVDPGWRRRGIARAMLNAACAWLISRNVVRISVVTPGRNAAALALYRAMGFQVSDERLWYHRWFQRPAPR